MKFRKHLVLFTLFVSNLVDQPAPEVRIDQGILSGKVSVDGSILEYVGIPYATTNSHTRFQAPLPPPHWEGVFKAVDEMYQCPQYTPFGVVGTEDCLKINVYRPATAERPLPVMVYIHGGGFIEGNGGKMVFGPEFIVKHDVILVTFNYRLGALGFLCLGTEEAPGNAGLKDQVAALRWVRRNIAKFGGDPDNVTLFGTSAGGGSVSLLVASEATNGLFKRAIVHSGSSLANWAVSKDPVLVASNVANLVGYNTKDPKELYKIYSKMSYKDLVLTTRNIPFAQMVRSKILHAPCVERNIPGVESVLTDLPYNLLVKKPKNIPLIYSTTDKEGLFFVEGETEDSLKILNGLNLFFDDLVFQSKKEEKAINQQLKEFYFGKKDISNETLNNLTDYFTHVLFEMPAILEAEFMARNIDAPVYSYYFTYSGGRNLAKYITRYRNEPGACHGDDILYIFKGLIWIFKINEKDQVIIDWMTKMLTNFAKTGDPTPKSANDLPIRWVPHSKDKLIFLNFNDELKMVPVPNPVEFRMWKEIYEKYRRTKIGWEEINTQES